MAIKTANDYLEESWSWKWPEVITQFTKGVTWLMEKGFTTTKDFRANEGFICHNGVRMHMKVWLADRRLVDIIVTGDLNTIGGKNVEWTAEYVFEDKHVEAFAFSLRGSCDVPALESADVKDVVIWAIREAGGIYELYDLERDKDEKAKQAVADFLRDRRSSDTDHQCNPEDCRYVPLIKEEGQ